MSVIWITGLAGVGKSTLAQRVAALLRAQGRGVLVLDGDAVRAALGDAGRGYTREARLAVAQTLARLAGLAAAQGLVVIVATISLFHAIHAENRRTLPGYFEVLVECPTPRSTLYTDAQSPLVGREIVAEFPLAPDLVVVNDGALDDVDALAVRVVEAWAPGWSESKSPLTPTPLSHALPSVAHSMQGEGLQHV